MSNERDLNPQTKEALEQKIRQLEQELALLRKRSSKTSSAKKFTSKVSPSQKSPTQQKPEQKIEIGLISNAWLISFGQYLLTEPDKVSVNSALERLGKLFDVQDCSLWRIKSERLAQESGERAGWNCLGHWQTEANIALRDPTWVEDIWKIDSTITSGPYGLNTGAPVALMSNDPLLREITAPLRAVNIASSLLVPVLRYNTLEGLVVLHHTEPHHWFPKDLERLKFIANALFTLNDRQQLVRQLSDRDTRFNYAIDASSDGLWDWNISTGKVYFSRSYLRMLGYRYEELPGNLTTLTGYFLYNEDVQMVMNRYQSAVNNHEANINLQFRMQHQNGKVLWVQSKAKFCEPDSNGRPTRCVGLNTDISDFILAREDLVAAKSQADLANKTKSEFLARMSHEIRTPMNAIIGLGYLLKYTELNEQQKSYLNSLNSASDSLLHIINEVLDFSKIDTGKIMLEHAHFDLDHFSKKYRACLK